MNQTPLPPPIKRSQIPDHAHTRFRRTPVRAAPLKVSLSNVNACHVFFYLTVLSLSRLKNHLWFNYTGWLYKAACSDVIDLSAWSCSCVRIWIRTWHSSRPARCLNSRWMAWKQIHFLNEWMKQASVGLKLHLKFTQMYCCSLNLRRRQFFL